MLTTAPTTSARPALEVVEPHTADAYPRLLANAALTGRCPVWTAGARVAVAATRDPASAVAAVARTSAGSVLEAGLPGAAISTQPPDQPVSGVRALACAAGWASAAPGVLVLVAARRPADVPAVVGWTGARRVEGAAVGLSAVLRRWEEHHGAVLVGLDETTLLLTVAVPPWRPDECLRAAVEHLALCRTVPAGVRGGAVGGLVDPRPYARALRGAKRWTLRLSA